MIAKACVYLLRNDVTAYGLIGNRIFPIGRPLTELVQTANVVRPFIVYAKIVDTRVGSLQGQPGTVKLHKGVMEFNAWSHAYPDSKAAMAAVVAALDEKRGTYNTVEVGAILLESMTDLEIPPELEALTIFGVGARFKCLWYE